jgi:uncharacterized membrane protein
MKHGVVDLYMHEKIWRCKDKMAIAIAIAVIDEQQNK